MVCNAGRRAVDAHSAPARNIANILQTTVLGSTAMVRHTYEGDIDIIDGDFYSFRPQGPVDDITSRMRHLSTRDYDPVDEITQNMGYMTIDTNGWGGRSGGRGSYGMDRDDIDIISSGMQHLSTRDRDDPYRNDRYSNGGGYHGGGGSSSGRHTRYY
ncbi:hypothetical protein [Streptomyces paludis]|uniref:Uncharacterized protein n=1 Tax=Streptomyces paludis TaxID=2282738 RepID=A0A345HRF1_9ACTN|nr:hypothetical protein [Streptomyces paludis]AXG79275.1 hypothetical protein DVK44_18235 [Streptomyces paludis]